MRKAARRRLLFCPEGTFPCPPILPPQLRVSRAGAIMNDLTAWALSQQLESTKRAGSYAQKVTLVALCQYANAEGMAWPSHSRLSDDLGGMAVSYIRDSLEALSDQGKIARARITAGRAVRWRILADPAGIPATHPADIPATHPADNPAGDPAGDLAGIPVPEGKGTELKGDASSPTNRTCTRHRDWNHSEPCRACMNDRKAAQSRPTVSQPYTVQPDSSCTTHRWMTPEADGRRTCMNCPTLWRPNQEDS